MVYKCNEKGRMVGAYGCVTSRGDDGYGNITTGLTQQIMTAVQGDLRQILGVSDSHFANADGSTNRTVIVTAYTYDHRGKVTGAAGKGHVVGSDKGFSDPENVWHDGWVDANANG